MLHRSLSFCEIVVWNTGYIYPETSKIAREIFQEEDLSSIREVSFLDNLNFFHENLTEHEVGRQLEMCIQLTKDIK